MAVEFFSGAGAGGVADDAWEILNGSILSDDGDNAATLIRLRGSSQGVETGNLESAEIGAYDEVALLLPAGAALESEGLGGLQSVNYGGIEITYDEAEESTQDPDVVALGLVGFYGPEEVYLEDAIALDGVYVLPSQATATPPPEQVVTQETLTTNVFRSDPTATYLIRSEATTGVAASSGAPSYSYSDTPGIINTGPRGMTITFSPYDLVMSARTTSSLETQVRRGTTSRSPASKTSRRSGGGSSGGGY